MAKQINTSGFAIDDNGFAGMAIEIAASGKAGKLNIRRGYVKEDGVVYGVKLQGVRSRNPAFRVGIGADQVGEEAARQPYSYSIEECQRTAKDFEGVSIFNNHSELETDPTTGHRRIKNPVRENEDFLGVVRDPIFVNIGDDEVDGYYGNWHLRGDDSEVDRFCANVATKFSDKFCFSPEREFRSIRVTDKGRVELCDLQPPSLVALTCMRGGTTDNLWESFAGEFKTMKRKIKFPALAAAIDKTHWLSGFAVEFGGSPLMAEAEAEIPAAAAAKPDAPVDSETAVKESLKAIANAWFEDPSLTDDQIMEKMKMLLALRSGKPAGSEPKESPDGDGSGGGSGDGKEKSGNPFSKKEEKATEIAAAESEGKNVAIECMGLLTAAGVTVDAELVGILCDTPKPQRAARVETFKKLQGKAAAAGTTVETVAAERSGPLPASADAAATRAIDPTVAAESAAKAEADKAKPVKELPPMKDVIREFQTGIRAN